MGSGQKGHLRVFTLVIHQPLLFSPLPRIIRMARSPSRLELERTGGHQGTKTSDGTLELRERTQLRPFQGVRAPTRHKGRSVLLLGSLDTTPRGSNGSRKTREKTFALSFRRCSRQRRIYVQAVVAQQTRSPRMRIKMCIVQSKININSN